MDTIAKTLASTSQKSRSSLGVNEELLDQAIASLEQIMETSQHDPTSVQSDLVRLTASIKSDQARAQDGHKEWHAALNRLGKEIDKKFNADLSPLLPVPPTQPPPANGTHRSNHSAPPDPPNPFEHMYFADERSRRILDGAIAMHFVREGKAALADTFVRESGVPFPAETGQQFAEMHGILDFIRQDDLRPALAWAAEHRHFLTQRDSPLEFHLHRSRFVRLLLSDSIPLPASFPLITLPEAADPRAIAANGTSETMDEDAAVAASGQQTGQHLAFAYARLHFAPFFASHGTEIQRLLTAALFLPLERLLRSPYADVFSPFPPPPPAAPAVDADGDAAMSTSTIVAPTDPEGLHAAHLVPLFSSEFCANLKMSRDLPLKVATDIGGGGALAKLAKVRSVMKEKHTEWTTVGELPVEIAVPPTYRFHSVFTCPVSKEQATDENPPMMMACGHVIAKDSLTRLSKGGNNVKCPYCPQQSSPSSAVRLYF